MIRIIYYEGNHRAQFICDICREPITDAQHGAAVWKHPEWISETPEPLHVHKGQCHNTADRRLVGAERGAPWMELSEHALQLAVNCKVLSLERAEQLEDELLRAASECSR